MLLPIYLQLERTWEFDTGTLINLTIRESFLLGQPNHLTVQQLPTSKWSHYKIWQAFTIGGLIFLFQKNTFLHLLYTLFDYSKKIVDGSEVIEEIAPKKKNNSNQLPTGISSDMNDQRGFAPSHMNAPTIGGPAPGHHDWISSLILCRASYWYVVSGSRDGVIKVWKWLPAMSWTLRFFPFCYKLMP